MGLPLLAEMELFWFGFKETLKGALYKIQFIRLEEKQSLLCEKQRCHDL